MSKSRAHRRLHEMITQYAGWSDLNSFQSIEYQIATNVFDIESHE